MQGMRMKSHRNQFTKQDYAHKDQNSANSPFWAAKKAESIEASPRVIALRRALAMKAAARKKALAKKAAPQKKALAKAKPNAKKPARRKARR